MELDDVRRASGPGVGFPVPDRQQQVTVGCQEYAEVFVLHVTLAARLANVVLRGQHRHLDYVAVRQEPVKVGQGAAGEIGFVHVPRHRQNDGDRDAELGGDFDCDLVGSLGERREHGKREVGELLLEALEQIKDCGPDSGHLIVLQVAVSRYADDQRNAIELGGTSQGIRLEYRVRFASDGIR